MQKNNWNENRNANWSSNAIDRIEGSSKALKMLNNFIERSNSNSRYKKLAEDSMSSNSRPTQGRNEDTNSYIRRVKDYLQHNVTPVKSSKSGNFSNVSEELGQIYNNQQENNNYNLYDEANKARIRNFSNHSPDQYEENGYQNTSLYSKHGSPNRIKKEPRMPLKGIKLGIFQQNGNSLSKKNQNLKKVSDRDITYIKGLKQIKNNKSNVSYFSREKTPQSQNSSKSHMKVQSHLDKAIYGAINYEKLTKARKSQTSNKTPKSPKSKVKSISQIDQNISNNSYRNSPTLNKYRNYQNFERVLRKSPRSEDKNSFLGQNVALKVAEDIKNSPQIKNKLNHTEASYVIDLVNGKSKKSFTSQLQQKKNDSKIDSSQISNSTMLKKQAEPSNQINQSSSSSNKNKSLLFKEEERNEFDSYFQLTKQGSGIFSETNFKKLKDLEFLRSTGVHLFEICSKLQYNQEVYELIRVYADIAQELEFDYLHKIFKDGDSQTLMSKVFKLERWAIILIFYFKVMKISGQKLDNNLKKLASETWKNHVYLVNWLKMLKVFGKMEQFDRQIYDEFKSSKDDLIVQIVGICSLIQSYIRKS